MVFALADGDITVHTGPDGTCGAFMDPSVKPPLAAFPLATAVVAGGGDGVISGGTGSYRTWTGTFTDRVFVGFGAPTSGVGGIVYYDQLIFRISGRQSAIEGGPSRFEQPRIGPAAPSAQERLGRSISWLDRGLVGMISVSVQMVPASRAG